MINLILDLLMDGSLKAEYLDPSIENEPRALGIVELSSEGEDVLFDVIWSLHGGNYVAFGTNPIMLAVLDKLGGTLVSGQLVLSKEAVASLTNLADAI
jgi:hypothetical protein